MNYCENCQGYIGYRPPSKVRTRIFCSPECRNEFGIGKLLKPLVCTHCGKSFQPKNGTQRVCSLCVKEIDKWREIGYRYDITREDFDEMLKKQNGTCALCDNIPTVIDHCHDTKKVRGILCRSCNGRMAGVDDKDWLSKALLYKHDPGT